MIASTVTKSEPYIALKITHLVKDWAANIIIEDLAGTEIPQQFIVKGDTGLSRIYILLHHLYQNIIKTKKRAKIVRISDEEYLQQVGPLLNVTAPLPRREE